jgi:F-type H+-transporting ATPase subunit b
MVPLFAADLMQIEPGLIFWTLVTFVCFFLLLRRFAWKPILGYVDAREKRIQDNIDTAKRDREEAQKLLEEHKRLLTESRKEGAEAVRKAVEAAEAARQDMLQKSRKEAEELIAQAKRQIDDEVKRAKTELSGMVVDLAMDAAEKVVGEALNDPQRQRKLVEQYVQSVNRQ